MAIARKVTPLAALVALERAGRTAKATREPVAPVAHAVVAAAAAPLLPAALRVLDDHGRAEHVFAILGMHCVLGVALIVVLDEGVHRSVAPTSVLNVTSEYFAVTLEHALDVLVRHVLVQVANVKFTSRHFSIECSISFFLSMTLSLFLSFTLFSNFL